MKMGSVIVDARSATSTAHAVSSISANAMAVLRVRSPGSTAQIAVCDRHVAMGGLTTISEKCVTTGRHSIAVAAAQTAEQSIPVGPVVNGLKAVKAMESSQTIWPWRQEMPWS
tara:strand:+ start:506 stop:844 length:339 start_codon:yes stop_codon:yes gene_type:complete